MFEVLMPHGNWHAKVKQKLSTRFNNVSLRWCFVCQNKFQLSCFIQQYTPTITIFTPLIRNLLIISKKHSMEIQTPSNGLILLKRSYQSYLEKI